jgi:hypothetical protein
MDISDEAVEEARGQLDNMGVSVSRKYMRSALEAAAPHLAAQALREAADALELQPPKLRQQYVAALRLYAEEPWRLGVEPEG